MDNALIVNAMVTQEDRRKSTPDADRVKIDGRNFEQLLAFGSQIAAEIRFFDLSDRPAGDWQEFFSQNPTALIASILAFDCSAPARMVEQWQVTADQQIAWWHSQLEPGTQHHPFADLFHQLQCLIDDFDDRDMATAEQYRGCIERMQQLARRYFESSLKWDGHPPQQALFMAFCELFSFAQRTANTIPERLIEFYYRDVIKFSDRPAQADEVALGFSLAEKAGVNSLTIPPDTPFSAGTDSDGRNITFANDDPIAVTRCKIHALQSLRIVDAPLGRWATGAFSREGAPATPTGQGHCHNFTMLDRPVRSFVVATCSPAGPPETDPRPDSIPPLFGAAVPGHSEGYTSELAEFGFTVSSTTLLLKGGKRTIKLRLWGAFSDDGPDAAALLATLAECTGHSEFELLARLFCGAFAISLSTAEGWVGCEIARVNVCSASPIDMEVELVLGSEFPAIAPLAAEEAYADTSPPSTYKIPTLRAIMRQQPVSIDCHGGMIEVFPFCILEGVRLTAIHINADVEQLPAERLFNANGELDPSNPFPVFGGEQAAGSYLDIAHSEIFAKPVSVVGIEIDWFALPANSGGFADYYRYYCIDPSGDRLCPSYGNEVFTCRLSVVQAGIWDLAVPHEQRKLYCTLSEILPLEAAGAGAALPEPVRICTPGNVVADGELCKTTRFEALQTVPSVPQPHYAPQDSAIRLTLTGPQYGYGFQLYAPNVLRSALAELPDGDETREQRCAAKCEKLHPTWARPLNELKQGLTLGADRKGFDYYLAIVPAIGKAIESLLRTFRQCSKSASTDGVPADIAMIGRQLGLFKREFSEKSKRNLIMRDTLRQWHEAVAVALEGPSPETSNCIQFLEIVLRIDLAFVETLVEQPGAPEDVFPINIEPVIEDLQGRNDTLIQPCCEDCLKIKTPAEPYVPQATSVLISYSASAASPSPEIRQSPLIFAHIAPFDLAAPVALGGTEPVSLLPEFDYQGALFVGLVDPPTGANQTFLADLSPNATASWLAQLPAPAWRAFEDNGWSQLPVRSVVKDGTLGLQQSGLIEIAIPQRLSISRLPDDAGAIGWLRASVAEKTCEFPDLRSIYANGGTARRIPDAVGLLAYEGPIPPGTITQTTAGLGELGAVLQPLPSIGGRRAIAGEASRIGNAERLRHKSRTIDRWDYEHFILDAFPAIAAVHVVQAGTGSRLFTSEQLVPPGSVLIIVLPQEAPGQLADPSRPITRPETLALIEAKIKEKASPFARICVANPPYVGLRVVAKVEFEAALKPGTGCDMLNQDLIAFLSPRTGDRQALPSVEYWQESEITDFVATRPYVKAILSLMVEEVESSSGEHPIKFFTSAREHLIEQADLTSEAGAGR